MKNTLFLLFSVVLCSSIVAQKRNLIKGKLLYKNTDVVAANVVNNTAQLFTITDADGEFEIAVLKGDEIIFSSVQYKIKSVVITDDILKKNRLVVSVNESINELNEVVVTSDNIEKFLNLKEEEFKGFDYERDKSSKLVNTVADDRQLKNGLDFVNIAKLIGKVIAGKSDGNPNDLKPSEVLPYVFDQDFFEKDLNLKPDQIIGFLEHIDSRLPSQKLLKQDKQFQLIDYLIEESVLYIDSLAL